MMLMPVPVVAYDQESDAALYFYHLDLKDNNQDCHTSGKIREKQNFLQVRELSGNFGKCQGIFAI